MLFLLSRGSEKQRRMQNGDSGQYA
jgi:hypothetical protein